MRITLSSAKSTKLARQDANVRIVDIAVQNISSTIPVFSFADDIGDRAERVNVGRPVELNCFLVTDAFCGDNLVVNRAKRRRNEAGACEIFHKIKLTQDDSPIKLPATRLTSGATLEVGVCCKG